MMNALERVPTGGNCQEAEDPEPWLDPIHHAGGPHLCAGCPVLSQCRAMAAQHSWVQVVVGGWRAPTIGGDVLVDGERPPWADGSPYPEPIWPRLNPPWDPELQAQASAVGMGISQYWHNRVPEGIAARRLQQRLRHLARTSG